MRWIPKVLIVVYVELFIRYYRIFYKFCNPLEILLTLYYLRNSIFNFQHFNFQNSAFLACILFIYFYFNLLYQVIKDQIYKIFFVI